MQRFRLYTQETEMKSLPAKIFFLSFTFLNLYCIVCIIVELFFKTQEVFFLIGYTIAVLFGIGIPAVAIIYCAFYYTYKDYNLFKYQRITFIFNFLYLAFLFLAAVYSFFFTPSA